MTDRDLTQRPASLLIWLTERVTALASLLDLHPGERRALLDDCRRLSDAVRDDTAPSAGPLRELDALLDKQEPLTGEQLQLAFDRLLETLPDPGPPRAPGWVTTAQVFALAVLVERSSLGTPRARWLRQTALETVAATASSRASILAAWTRLSQTGSGHPRPLPGGAEEADPPSQDQGHSHRPPEARLAWGRQVDRAHVFHKTILAFDIERFGGPERSDAARLMMRTALSRLIRDSLAHAIGLDRCWLSALGNGMLVLIDPTVPRTRLPELVMGDIATGLQRYNQQADANAHIRLRVVLHAGEVVQDDQGFYGEELNLAFLLLDSAALQAALRTRPTDIGLIVSKRFYDTILQQGWEGIDPTQYDRVDVDVKETVTAGWIHVPTDDHR